MKSGCCDSPAQKIDPYASVDDILNIALSYEKNTIIFFSSIKALMKDINDKNKIEILINEEVSHIVNVDCKKRF